MEKGNEDDNADTYDDWNQEELINEVKRLKSENKSDELTKKVNQLEKMMQQLVEEIQELRTEIQQLKKENNNSEYHTYYLNRQESQLRDRESRLEQIKDIINSNPNSNNFPTNLIVGGGVLLAVIGLVAILFAVKKIKKKRKSL